MKTKILTVTLLGLFICSGFLAAQDPVEDIPFRDRDGDGVNDFLQSERGQKMLERHQKRQAVWEQLGISVIRPEEGQKGLLVDTDNDGVGDISMREYMQANAETQIDTDGDGVADTALKDVLRGHRGAFERDEDGKPKGPGRMGRFGGKKGGRNE